MTVARPSFPHSDLEGTVKYQPAVSERTAGIDWSQWFLSCLFAPVLLLVRPAFLIGGMLHLGRYHGRKIPVLLASIEESGSGGILRQARFEGELTLSGVNQGDEVSLWGKMRGGVLLVKGGYNYTHSADIKLQQRHIPYVWRSIAYAVIAVIVLVILTTLLSSPH
ncbi:MAG TPA: hypothetical protein VNE38_21595 [Ktedonobacteraceae bacterium]|nr:hypothetical protein [Ktedonobacteraceae bacterium]